MAQVQACERCGGGQAPAEPYVTYVARMVRSAKENERTRCIQEVQRVLDLKPLAWGVEARNFAGVLVEALKAMAWRNPL